MASSIATPGKPYTAPTKFRTNAPWEMRKMFDEGCLCKSCESFHCLRRGLIGASAAIDLIVKRIEESSVGSRRKATKDLEMLQRIKSILATPSKYDTIVECLQPCLCSRKLEDAKPLCLLANGCDKCGFKQLWSGGLRAALMDENGGMANGAPLAGQEWLQSGIDWRYYTSVAKPTVANHAEGVARLAAAARGGDGDTDYNPNESNTTRTLCLATKRGTLVDFLDEFECQSAKHAEHRNIVSTERKAQINYDRNVRPLIVKRDIDFSENGTISNKRQIQSQYWVTIGYTLFVSIASWLEAAEWNKESGVLPVGAEVTVYGEKSNEKLNSNSFWATVTKVSDSENDLYEVKDEHGASHNIHRAYLRHRKRRSIASGHVTDDKVHDRHAMQHFTTNELVYLEGYMKEHFPEDIPLGHIARLHQHSDNAGQHFKNTGAINYYTTLIDERGGPSETAFVYSFGTPGHGKGPYDGIGGRWKRKIDQCMSTAKIGLLECTASGFIQDVDDVHSALE